MLALLAASQRAGYRRRQEEVVSLRQCYMRKGCRMMVEKDSEGGRRRSDCGRSRGRTY